ncbi:bifunctional heptose 7-phosphate kinase/heptose 1-phosphate adenyltransferase [Aridibaculum aurantiacum]|uniref:bifunctional heptose 7-phosphate kinase/heptose 1-phosphate adenyltransferase n=1 Tax=Aridibaculum aurantiacum TaxID=2810307 RepID=UPI001A965CCD|nr:PfkB family carbohydrate kinase [Aridibaculum aurantiacum]
MQVEDLFKHFAEQKVAVVGDVMLDTYWWGHVERISPEAPVPVVALDKKELRLGGAGNVALNTVALGASTAIFSVIGNDEDGETLTQLLAQHNINTRYIVKSNNRVTTNKTRIISRNQHMMRLDSEITHDINSDEQAQLVQAFEEFVKTEKPSVVVFEDYNKGVLTSSLIQQLITLCNEHGIITTVDPKRKNFFSYKGISIFKPNLKEVKEGLNLLLEDINEPVLREIHAQLKDVLQHDISLITLSEKGVFYQHDNSSSIIPTHVRSIADVSGAGDTVIAVASLVYAASRNINLAAAMANIAGGLVCEEVGTVAINKTKLFEECRLLLN